MAATLSYAMKETERGGCVRCLLSDTCRTFSSACDSDRCFGCRAGRRYFHRNGAVLTKTDVLCAFALDPLHMLIIRCSISTRPKFKKSILHLPNTCFLILFCILSPRHGKGVGKRERRARILRANRQHTRVVLRSGMHLLRLLRLLLLFCLHARLCRLTYNGGGGGGGT